MITRRTFLRGIGVAVGSGIGLAGYAFGIEPLYRLSVTTYRVTPRNWPSGLRVKLAIVADLHAHRYSMPIARIEEIVTATNGVDADAILLLGDYMSGKYWRSPRLAAEDWAPILGQLRAPLGVHAVLGNHDWWEEADAQRLRRGPVPSQLQLEKAGIPVYQNEVVRLTKDGQPFWLAGLADQIAFITGIVAGRMVFQGLDDLPGTLAKITDDAPVILMAHEPDIFPKVPDRVALTLSGHTHGGQVRLFGWSPIVPSEFGNRYAYGHVTEDKRHLIVSGGLGCSILPLRFGVPPEIVVVELGADA
ncbi:MAG: metallophosphoesterase [Hyphomicrobium sp. 32-62-53]|nr:MAG: metallophosphoesterase [Hyphomicrobium sp. 12-62-95]OYX98290.1 MAG: metallophosphoesterase [Hyphomicrobium sp. 32-62-53]